MQRRLKQVGVFSLAKLVGVLGLLGGLCLGALYGFYFGGSGFLLYMLGGGAVDRESVAWLTATGSGILLITTLVYGLLGFLSGLVYAIFINLALRITNGLSYEVEEELADHPVRRRRRRRVGRPAEEEPDPGPVAG